MDTVFDRYEIEVIPDKAPATQVGYRQMMSNLHQFFGRMDPKDLRQHNAALYRDKRKVKAPTQANRELQLLSTVCTMAVEWGAMELHPLRGLRKVPTRPRDRYVSDAEYVVTHSPYDQMFDGSVASHGATADGYLQTHTRQCDGCGIAGTPREN